MLYRRKRFIASPACTIKLSAKCEAHTQCVLGIAYFYFAVKTMPKPRKSASHGYQARYSSHTWSTTEICSRKARAVGSAHADPPCSTSTEKAIHEYILPLPKNADDEKAWVDRLLLVMQHLDPQTSMKGLLRATRLQERRPGIYERFLDACSEYNVSARLWKTTRQS